MESRLVDLEVRYTHLARQMEELSQVVFAQQKTINRLTQELAAWRARAAGVEDGPGQERPPHY
jgi:SlyX protein